MRSPVGTSSPVRCVLACRPTRISDAARSTAALATLTTYVVDSTTPVGEYGGTSETDQAGASDHRGALGPWSLLGFKLKVHLETRDVPVYALVLARSDRVLGGGIRPSACAAKEKISMGPDAALSIR